MREELTTNEGNTKEGSKSKVDEYLLKKFHVQVKKVDEDPHSNNHLKSNVTTMKSTIDKEDDDDDKDDDIRRNKMKNVKLNEDVILWKKKREKQKFQAKDKRNQALKERESNLKISNSNKHILIWWMLKIYI